MVIVFFIVFLLCYFANTGDIVLKPTWGRDQPNNYNGEQNCVVLDGGRNWLWNDVGCNLDYLHFICQHGKFFVCCSFSFFQQEQSKNNNDFYGFMSLQNHCRAVRRTLYKIQLFPDAITRIEALLLIPVQLVMHLSAMEHERVKMAFGAAQHRHVNVS